VADAVAAAVGVAVDDDDADDDDDDDDDDDADGGSRERECRRIGARFTAARTERGVTAVSVGVTLVAVVVAVAAAVGASVVSPGMDRSSPARRRLTIGMPPGGATSACTRSMTVGVSVCVISRSAAALRTVQQSSTSVGDRRG